jgi:hypothetical protein
VSELRATQRHAEPVDKAHEWAENLLCLRYQASSGCCFRKIYNCGLDVRDSVLDEVVSYLEACRIDTLWIDIACIDQANPDKKQKR